MTGSSENLVIMANQIARFFQSQGAHTVAVDGVTDHIRSFWNPSMRRALLGQMDAGEAEGLSPIAAEALERLRR
jgi:formate dehydrogenase subunit delta